MINWVINNEIGFVKVLEDYGRFLENDYRMIIEHLAVPNIFEEYTEKTGRRFVLVGGNDAPWALAKSVYLCLKLAGPESVIVRTHHLDEAFMVQNVFDYHANGVRNKIFITNHDENIEHEWRDEIDKATDIMVFGDKSTMEAFRDYERVDRRVWERGNKFSFGIVREEHLTPTNINQICFDFFSFYGEGSLAPKLYFVIGKVRKKHAKQFSENMIALYSMFIKEYRDKLPFTRRSELVSQTIDSNYVGKYVRLDNLTSDDVFANLYGDVRLIQVDDLYDVEQFIEEWQDNINTVAINMDDDEETNVLLEDKMIIRVCHIGNMQFPEFFDQYDNVDDFNVYVDEE